MLGESLLGRAVRTATKLTTAVLPDKAGVTMAGQATENLTFAQRFENLAARLGPGGSGVGPALSRLGAVAQHISILDQNLYSWLFDAPSRAISRLSDREKATVAYLLDSRQADGGNRLLAALQSPEIPVGVKDAIQQTLDGPLRFATEEDIFKATPGEGLHAVVTPSGKTGYWTGPRLKVIDDARKARLDAQRAAMKGYLALDRHVTRMEQLDAALTQHVGAVEAVAKKARVEVARDAGLLDNGLPFLVMEFLEGSDLAALLSSRGPLPHAEVVDLVLEALEGLDDALDIGLLAARLVAGIFQRAERCGQTLVSQFALQRQALKFDGGR